MLDGTGCPKTFPFQCAFKLIPPDKTFELAMFSFWFSM